LIRKHQDSANILQYIAGLKKRETDFYMSLNLKEDLKIDLFKIKPSPGEEVRSDIKPPKRREENDLLILQHPLQGNLVITKEDLNQFENQTLQK